MRTYPTGKVYTSGVDGENMLPKKRGRPKGAKDKKKRNYNPKTLENLAPQFKAGEVHNPEGKNGRRPITDEYFLIAEAPLPETVRRKINTLLGGEYLPQGITFAKSLSIRMYLEGVLTGSVSAATEVREAMEGRATTRLEFVGRNDRLEGLINALNSANKNAPPAPSPDSAAAAPTPSDESPE